MTTQTEAERLADALQAEFPGYEVSDVAAAELRRLREENEGLRKAYWKMRNSAAGYSNFCEDSASTRRCERDYEEGEALYRAAIPKGEQQ